MMLRLFLLLLLNFAGLSQTLAADCSTPDPALCLTYPYATDFEGTNTEWTTDNDWLINSAGHSGWQARSGTTFLDNNPLEIDQEYHRNHYAAMNKAVYIPFDADQPTLSYYYKAAIFSGRMFSMISTDGVNWATLDTYRDSNNHGEYTKREVNLESYKGQSVQIRFRQYFDDGVGPRLFVVDDFRIGDFQADTYSYPYNNGFETPELRGQFNYEGDWNSTQTHNTDFYPNEGSYFLSSNYNNEDQSIHREHFATMNGFVLLPATGNHIVSFDYLADVFNGQTYIQIQEYGTNTWTTIKYFREEYNFANHTPYTTYEYNLANYLGKNVRFRFRQWWNEELGARRFLVDNFYIGEQNNELPFPYKNNFETNEEIAQWYPDGDWNMSTVNNASRFASNGSGYLDNNPDIENQAQHVNHYATLSGFIQLPENSNNVVVRFDYLAEVFDGQAYIYIQKLGQTNWTTLKVYRQEFNRSTYATEEISLAAYAGEKVRFSFRQVHYNEEGPRKFLIDNFNVQAIETTYNFPYINDFETAVSNENTNGQDHWQNTGGWNTTTAHDSNYNPNGGSYFLSNNAENKDQALHREHYTTMKGYVALPENTENVVVSFDYLADLFDGQVYVHIQKLGQSNWTNLRTYNHHFNRSSYGHEELSLEKYAGEKVRFRFRQYFYSEAGARVFTIDNFKIEQINTTYTYPYLNDFETPVSTENVNGQDQWKHTGDWDISEAHDSVYVPKSGDYFLSNNVNNADQAYHRNHYSTMQGFVSIPAEAASPMISFDYISNLFDGQVYLNIQEQGSNKWTTLRTFREDLNHTPYTKYEYSLHKYVGKKVRFQFRQYYYTESGARLFPIDNIFVGELTETLPFPYYNDFETAVSVPAQDNQAAINGQDHWHSAGDWNITTAHNEKWYPNSGNYFLSNNSNNEDQTNHRNHYATMSGYIQLPEDTSNVVVSYDYLLNTFDGQFYIYIQKAGQTGWTYLKIYKDEHNRTTYTRDEISLAAYAGEKVRFRFRQYHYASNGARVFAIDNFKVEVLTLEEYGYPYFNDFETPLSSPAQDNQEAINGQDQWKSTGNWGISKAHDTVYVPESGEFFLDNNINNEDQALHREHYATMQGFVTLPEVPQNPMVSFNYNADFYDGQTYLQIQVLGSNQWINLRTFRVTENHTPYTTYEYFLNAYAGKKVRFRFRQYWNAETGSRVFSIDNFFIGELTQELPYPYKNTFETEKEQQEFATEGDWGISTEHDAQWYPKTGSYFLDGNADNEDQSNHREHFATLTGYIPLPEDTSNVVVSFDFLLNTFSGQPYIYIQKFGESKWTYLRAYTESYNHDGYAREEIPLNAYAGEKVRFRFRQYYYSEAGSRVFGIDNFQVGEVDLPDYKYPYANDFETDLSTETINGKDHWSLMGDWNISTEHDTVYKPKNGTQFLDNNADNEDQSSHRAHFASILGFVPIAEDALNPQLSFWYNAQVFDGFVFLELQEKGSNSWKRVFTFREHNSSNDYTKFYYDLSAYKGKSVRVRIHQYWYSDSGARVFSVDDFRIGDDDRIGLSYPYTNTFETEEERDDFIPDGDWGISTAHDTDYVPYEGDWFIDNNANFEDQQGHVLHYITLANYIAIPSNANVPTLSFWYKANTFDTAVHLEIRRKGETSWTNLFRFVEPLNHDEYTKFELHLDSYKGDEVLFRFRQHWTSTPGPRLLTIDNFRLGDLEQQQYVFPYFNNFDTEVTTSSVNGRDQWNTQHDWKVSNQNEVTGSAESGDWFLDNNPDGEEQLGYYNHYANMHGFIAIPADAVNPELSFDYISDLEKGYVHLHIQRAGSSNWTTLKTFSTKDDSATYKNYSQSLNTYKGESVRFRFRQYHHNLDGNRIFHLDNFTVDQDLLGMWYFEKTWQDATGNNFNLSPVNTPSFSQLNRAQDGDIGSNTSTCSYAEFENDQYASIANSAAQNNFNALTVSAWINPASLSNALSTIVSKGEQFAIYVNNDGKIEWHYLDTVLVSSSAIGLNEWSHIAVTFEDAQQHIYINGTLVASASISGTLIELDTELYVAAGYNNASNNVDSNRFFKGAIDELRIYRVVQNASAIATDMNVLHPCEINPTPDHYLIQHDGLGLTCEAETITLKACNDELCEELNQAPKTVNLLVNGVSVATTTFTGETTINFNQSLAATVNLSVSVDENNTATNSLQCTGGETGSPCSMVFNAAELMFLNNQIIQPIDHQTSGINFNHSIQIKAIQSNNGVCQNLFTNKTVNLDFKQENIAPTNKLNSGLPLTINNTEIPRDQFQSIPLTFNSDGVATLPAITYFDAGQIRLLSRYVDNDITLTGITNSFWVKPAELKISVSSVSDNAALGSTIKAGLPFNFVVKAFNAQGQSNQYSDEFITQNYVPSDLQLAVTRTAPTGSSSYDGKLNVAGALINSAISPEFNAINLTFTNGVATNQAKYSEVGNIETRIKDLNYGGINGLTIDAAEWLALGRFTPDHFALTLKTSGEFTNTCELGETPFNYIGQPFSYKSLPQFLIKALNTDGEVTQNYTHSSFNKLSNGSSEIQIAFPLNDSDNPLINVEREISAGTFSIAKDNANNELPGYLDYTFSDTDTFTYVKDVNTQIDKFLSNYVIVIDSIKDSDNVQGYLEESAKTGTLLEGTDSLLVIVPNPVEFRYGRFVLADNFGPETSNLPITLSTQYWNGVQFIPNIADRCTAFNTNQLTISNTGLTSILADKTGTLINGATKQLILKAPGANKQGTTSLEYDSSLTPWLQYNWSETTEATNPKANAVFGIFRGNDRVIYWREVF